MKVVTILEKPHKCTQCDKRFTSNKNIRRHMERFHSENIPDPFQCHHCKKIYQNKGNHDAHFETHHLTEQLLYVEPEQVVVKGTSM